MARREVEMCAGMNGVGEEFAAIKSRLIKFLVIHSREDSAGDWNGYFRESMIGE